METRAQAATIEVYEHQDTPEGKSKAVLVRRFSLEMPSKTRNVLTNIETGERYETEVRFVWLIPASVLIEKNEIPRIEVTGFINGRCISKDEWAVHPSKGHLALFGFITNPEIALLSLLSHLESVVIRQRLADFPTIP